MQHDQSEKQYPDGNKIQVFNYATIENLKPLNLLDLSRNNPPI